MRKRVLCLSLLAFALCGFFSGLFFPKSEAVEAYFLEIGRNYMLLLFSPAHSALRIFFKRILSLLVFFLIGILVNLSAWLFPVHLLFLYLKSYLFGCLAFALCAEFSVHGFFVCFLVTLPEELIFGAFFLVQGARCLEGRFCPIEHCVVLGIPLLLSALWETMIVLLLFRPLNFIG